jgi:hypothetical protein
MAPKDVSFTIRAKDAFSAVLKQVQGTADGTVSKLFSLKTAFSALGGALAGLSLAAIIKDLYELGVASDKAFRQMAVNLPTAHEGLQQLKKDIEELAIASGRSLDEVQKGAVEITRLGVGSAEEVQKRLTAGASFADATARANP